MRPEIGADLFMTRIDDSLLTSTFPSQVPPATSSPLQLPPSSSAASLAPEMAEFPFQIFLLLLFCSTAARSLRFDLKSGGMKCISEDIMTDAMSVGKYSVIAPDEGHHPVPDSHKISARVTSPYGNSIHQADQVESGNFAFTSSEAGNYLACFFTGEHKPPVTVTVDFDWKTGVAAKDWTNVAKKGKVDVMELELKKMDDTIKSILDEMLYLREREEDMQNLNKATNTNMAILTGVSFLICLSVAGLQLWHLKTFFERKKIL